MSTRVLAFVVLLPIAAIAGYAAGRASTETGIVTEAWSPDGESSVAVERKFSFGPADERLVFASGEQETELRAIGAETRAKEIVWAPDGSLAGVVLGGMTLAVIDPDGPRMLYELPLVEQRDGSRVARGVGFSANALAITFDDCPRRGAGCRPRFMALPTRP